MSRFYSIAERCVNPSEGPASLWQVGKVIDDVPAKVLAVYAHPDDPDLSCGGTLARWSSLGAQVHVCLCAEGDKGSMDPEVDSSELVLRRRAEADAAGAVLGVSTYHRLGMLDGELEDSAELRRSIVTLVRQIRPDVVIAADPTAVFFGSDYVNHRDHRVTGWAALDAVAPAAANPHYFPGSGTPHQVTSMYLSGTLEPDVFIDISSTIDVKAAAVACHVSQLGEGGEWLRTVVRDQAESAGKAVGVAFAEAFRLVSLG